MLTMSPLPTFSKIFSGCPKFIHNKFFRIVTRVQYFLNSCIFRTPLIAGFLSLNTITICSWVILCYIVRIGLHRVGCLAAFLTTSHGLPVALHPPLVTTENASGAKVCSLSCRVDTGMENLWLLLLSLRSLIPCIVSCFLKMCDASLLFLCW